MYAMAGKLTKEKSWVKIFDDCKVITIVLKDFEDAKTIEKIIKYRAVDIIVS